MAASRYWSSRRDADEPASELELPLVNAAQ
jgi:hypothetical protein